MGLAGLPSTSHHIGHKKCKQAVATLRSAKLRHDSSPAPMIYKERVCSKANSTKPLNMAIQTPLQKSITQQIKRKPDAPATYLDQPKILKTVSIGYSPGLPRESLLDEINVASMLALSASETDIIGECTSSAHGDTHGANLVLHFQIHERADVGTTWEHLHGG